MARSKQPRGGKHRRRTGKKPRPCDTAGLPLSICIIAKNEEANLPPLLESIAPLEAEIVVVDTGSTDATADIVEAAGAKLVRWAWRDDFAAARNVSLDHATRSWILWLDADDRLPAASLEPLRKLARQPANQAYQFVVKNTTNDGFSGTEFSQLRMFPNRRRLRFVGPIHEQIAFSVQSAGIPVSRIPVVIHHTGYANTESVQAKQRRNREILLGQVQRPEANGLDWFQLATANFDLQDYAEAETCFRTAMDLAANQPICSYLRAIIPSYIALIRLRQGNHADALAIFQELADPDPSTWHPNQIAIAGELFLNACSAQEATGWFDRAYTPPQPESMLPLDPKTTAFSPLRFLADYWRREGHDRLAVDFLRILRDVMQGDYPPRRAIPDAYLRNGMPDRAAGLYAWCIDVDGEDPGLWAGLVRATAMAADEQTALGFLEAGLAKWPDHPELMSFAQPVS